MTSTLFSYVFCLFIHLSNGHSHKWTEIYGSDTATGNKFGHAVAISEDTAIVGAYRDDHDHLGIRSGSAYIFSKDSVSGNWDQETKLLANDRRTGDRFGYSVGISKNRVIVGARRGQKKIGDGVAYIFTKDKTTGNWSQTAKLSTDVPDANTELGFSVAISGNSAIIGKDNYSSLVDCIVFSFIIC